MMRGLANRIALVQLALPLDLAHTNTKSKLVDLQGWKAVAFVVDAGAATGGDVNNFCTPKLQESATTNDVDFTDVASADYTEIPTGQGDVNVSNLPAKLATAGEARLLGYIGRLRYVRVVLTYTGVAITAGLIGVTAILGGADQMPTTSASSTQGQPTDGTPQLYAGIKPPTAITAT